MSVGRHCMACGGLLGRDCFNEQECVEITRQQAMAAQEQGRMTSFEQVGEFHRAFGVPALDVPAIPDQARIDLRFEIIREELRELIEAIERRDMVAIADGLGDLRYVVDGTAHEFGIPLDKVSDAIHRANMSKLGADGKPIYREDGKVLKGPNFVPPEKEIAAILRAAGWGG